MVSFLKRVRMVFKEDKNIVSSVDFVASGRAKLRDESVRREEPRSKKAGRIPLLPEQ